jgi:hypothetical protein
MTRLRDVIIAGLLLGTAHGIQAANAASVVPNFTTGTVTSETTSRTEVTEVINVVEYSTATSYTVSGTNINIPSSPSPGTNYTIVEQGAPFQFSETHMTPGISSVTDMTRTTVTDSFTTSISVFTQ